jgi:asparagine synthase (glutamine-hydrolysing)
LLRGLICGPQFVTSLGPQTISVFLVPVPPGLLRRHGHSAATIKPPHLKVDIPTGRIPFGSRHTAEKTALAADLNEQDWTLRQFSWLGLLLEMVDRHSFSFGVETRHPFMDRRIVEFCLSLPEKQRWRGEQMKFVLRTAMKGILPESVRTRRSKANFTGTFSVHLLTSEVRGSLESSTLASFGWINQAQVLRMYSQFKSDYDRGHPNPRFVAQLSMIYGIESWMRHAF